MSVVPICVWDLPSHRHPPSRNLYPTSWFILSVLFFTANEMSVVPIHVWDYPSHRPPPYSQCLPDRLVHSVCVVFERW